MATIIDRGQSLLRKHFISMKGSTMGRFRFKIMLVLAFCILLTGNTLAATLTDIAGDTLPEPVTLLLLGAGMILLAGIGRQNKSGEQADQRRANHDHVNELGNQRYRTTIGRG
jgi:hypothetical protein